MQTMSGKTCLVTGATSGIGRQTALRLAKLGANVIIVGRDPARGEAAGDEILARDDRLDVLVNNAGVISTHRQLTTEGLETTFATNHLGPFLLTNLLRDRLERCAPARVVTVSSAVHKQVRTIAWSDLARGTEAGQAQAYPVSKLLNILFTVELATRLASTGVTANCLHPGFVRTALGRDVTGVLGAVVRLVLGFRPGPATGAETSVHLASSPAVAGVTGGYFVNGKPAEPRTLARDGLAAARLWALSEELAGLSNKGSM